MNQQPTQPLKPLEEISDEWFVNRQTELDFFWQWANSIPLAGRHSVAFAGRRRTGKTAILHRVFNRLFTEQERVLPVFITFEQYLQRPTLMTTYEFAEDYMTGYLRSYFAFRYRRPDFHRKPWKLSELHQFAQEVQDKLALDLINSYTITRNDKLSLYPSANLADWAVNVPKGQAAVHNLPTAVFIDEFQILANVYDPDHDRIIPVTNYYQKASESLIAPMVVAGSSVSLLLGRATGGALSGRMSYRILGPLEQGHAITLVLRLGEQLNIRVTEEFAFAVWELTQGYPYAIESLLRSISPATERYPDPAALEEVVSFELTHPSGYLFQHYNEEFFKYSTLLNDGETTKKVMFWTTQYPDKRIEVEEIAAKIGVTPQEVHGSLQKLEQLDIVQRISLSLYSGPTEPMLRRFITYQYDFEIRKLTEEQALKNIERQVNEELGRERNIIGRFAEIVVGAVMKGFTGETLDGPAYFSHPELVVVPKFRQIEQRWGVIEQETAEELDLIGEYPMLDDVTETQVTAAWFVQVKYRKRAVDKRDVEQFLQQIAAIQNAKNYASLTHWYVSKGGFTAPAQALLQELGIYYTDLAQFNALAKVFGIWGFPEKVRL